MFSVLRRQLEDKELYNKRMENENKEYGNIVKDRVNY